jgi:hypothetical protein
VGCQGNLNGLQVQHESLVRYAVHRQKLTRQRELFKRGHITQVEYEQAFLFIDRPLQRLQPSAQPEVRQVILFLEDLSAL